MTTTSRSLLLAVGTALALGACASGPPPPPDSIYEGSPRYGSGSQRDRNADLAGNRYGAGSPERERARDDARNRFGYGGADEEAEAPAPAVRERSDRRRDRVVSGEEDGPADDPVAMNRPEEDAKPEPKPEQKPKPKTPAGTPQLSEMPYAKGVPGNPLAVTVPGYAYVGEVSIEKLDKNGNPSGEPQPPGTAVQIPDPQNPGKTIYFRVP